MGLYKGLVTNYRRRGSYKTGGGGGHVKFYPYEKGGGEIFSHAMGGGGKKFRVVFTYSLKF